MPKKKKSTAAQRRAKAKANVAANKRGYVTGPRGGSATAERVGRKPPKTSGPGIFGRKKGADLRKAAGSSKKKSFAEKGAEAINERKRMGKQIEAQALGKQSASKKRGKSGKKKKE